MAGARFSSGVWEMAELNNAKLKKGEVPVSKSKVFAARQKVMSEISAEPVPSTTTQLNKNAQCYYWHF